MALPRSGPDERVRLWGRALLEREGGEEASVHGGDFVVALRPFELVTLKLVVPAGAGQPTA